MRMGSRRKTRLTQTLSLLVMLGIGWSPAYAKRDPPKEVRPVSQSGVEYSATYRGFDCGSRSAVPETGGYVQARDTSGRLLWELRVYEVKYDCNIETDVQDIFIKSLKIAGNDLQVVNEKEDKFVVDLSKRRVGKGAGRVYQYVTSTVDSKLLETAENGDAFYPLLTLAIVVGLVAIVTRMRGWAGF
jgi:hypothetical protein